ncbi:hypothetical protein J2X72_003438 [Phyllobacterium sp. 1468]|uniref:hypothetical protein n=1 Tax=Phyllobacterium sp. 1468 TaxID=2817759 RepID=UPI002854D6E1|nr:hypothetical protein [Phyllobacterium sp. 1468]MDR6634628.1 hypothetical protein [Phyllobacterium sp. 1468]
MVLRTTLLAVTMIAGISLSGHASQAEDAIASPAAKSIGAAKPKIEPALIVLNSRGASITARRLVLTGVSPNSIMFADRPVRAAGHVSTSSLIEEWAAGSDSFAKDPPNATVSVLSQDGKSVLDAVVTLKAPKLEGETLAFEVDVLEGNIDGAAGAAATFIDIIGMPFTPVSFAGAARRAAYRGAWYAGAAAAAAAPYYYSHPYYTRPACGPYPYPPCY